MKYLAIPMFLLLAAAAEAQTSIPSTPPTPGTLSITGLGRVMVPPDRVTFTVGVETQAKVVSDAVAENNRRTAAVIAALKSAGAKEDQIRTSNFSIFPQQQYVEGQRPRIVGYQVNNSVTVTRPAGEDAGRLLQAAIDAGVNTASGLSFVVSDPSLGRDEGLRRAFDDARAKGEVLARAAGRSLGRALTIAEGATPVTPGPRPPMAQMAEMKMAAAVDVPVESGTEERQFIVSVVFELR